MVATLVTEQNNVMLLRRMIGLGLLAISWLLSSPSVSSILGLGRIQAWTLGGLAPKPRLAGQMGEVSVRVSALAFAISHSSKAVLVANLSLI